MSVVIAESMSGDWTTNEEDLLVENLESGYDLLSIVEFTQRTPEDVAMKVIELSLRGDLIILATTTLKAWMERTLE